MTAPESPGMVVDGDVLRGVIAEAVADAALDGAVRAGMTVLHGPNYTPRVVKREETP